MTFLLRWDVFLASSPVISIYLDSLPANTSTSVLTMDLVVQMLPPFIRKFSTHIDFVGQRKAERLLQVRILLLLSDKISSNSGDHRSTWDRWLFVGFLLRAHFIHDFHDFVWRCSCIGSCSTTMARVSPKPVKCNVYLQPF